jgi:hypothetical protein
MTSQITDSGCLQYFEDLGRLVEGRWSSRQHDKESFPEIACQALAELPPAGQVTADQILHWARRSPALPVQPDLEGVFGEPPLCVFWSPQFYIQALYWLDGTTAIHQHGFQGAFHVLAGSSIHTRHDFRVEDRVNERMLLGHLDFQDCELLGAGQTRPIPAGNRLIHALFHLDRPSVTLVIRTHHDEQAGPQYSYQRPHLASDPFDPEIRLDPLVTILQLLQATDPAAYDRALDEAVVHREYRMAYEALQCANHRGASEERMDALLRRARSRHGQRVVQLEPIFEHQRRENHIVSMRKAVMSAEHRFFFALLLNLPRRDLVAKMVRLRYPQRDPAEVILSWLDELSRIPVADGALRSPLGALQFGESEAIIFRELIGGSSQARIIDQLRLADYHVDGQEAAIEDFCRTLTRSSLFTTLFS